MQQTQNDEQYWWQLLPAIPPKRNSRGYRRLDRVWRDHTRIHNRQKINIHLHDFFEEHYEVHLVCTLFENFSIFSPEEWVVPFMVSAGLPRVNETVTRCAWSYEWEANSDRNGKQCDVVISFETSTGQKGAVIVEAKNLTTKPSEKDFDIDYYLAEPIFEPYRNNLSLVYLVGSKVKKYVATNKPEQTGLITWQELGALQIRLAHRLAVDARVKQFVAGAIQYHYLHHNITPNELCADYLSEEPSLREILDRAQTDEKQTSAERAFPIWELD